MCDQEAIKELQAALLRYTKRTKQYREMSTLEQTVEELSNALYMRLEHLKRCEDPKYDACEQKAERMELGDLFHLLGSLSDSGTLEQAMSVENHQMLKSAMRGFKDMSASLAEQGLRKKDMAAYLRHSGDTDIMVDKHREIDSAVKGKDR